MKISPFRRLVAVLLCVQPVFWMSSVALAQSFDSVQQPQSPADLYRQQQAQPSGDTYRQRTDLESQQQQSQQQLGGTAPTVGPGTTEQEISPEPRTPALPSPTRPPIDEPVDPDKYVLGHGDVLELNLFGVQNVSLKAIVDVEGRIFVPKVGYFDLKNRTLTEARRIISGAVSKYYRLNFGLSLVEPRTFLVQVVDDVARPGSYPARATERAATVITRAGGLARNSSLRRIEIRRRDGKVLPVDLLLYRITGDVKYNPLLLDGDIVRVPFEELVARIEGAVNRPGRYELTGSRDLAELVELAGGLAPSSTKALPISVTRRDGGDKQKRLILDWTDAGVPSATLQFEDVVRIPMFTEVELSVLVLGAVAGSAVITAPSAAGGGPATRATTTLASAPDEASATRRVPYVAGDTVRSILERVGGVGPLADLPRAYIRRGDQTVPVNLEALVMLRDMSADKPMQLGDILVIPFRRTNVVVEGAVFAPGQYPYRPNFGIEHYLSLAGGTNRFAQSIEDVRLVEPDGTTKQYSAGLKVEPGSSIVVPERNFSRSEVVSIILAAAGIALSGVAVVIAAGK